MIFFSSFFPSKFCDFFIVLNFYIVYSNTLYCTHNVYIKKILIIFRYNRCQDTLHTDERGRILAKDDHNFTMENFHRHNVHIAKME